nr:oocyte-secreted protein 1-like [Microcebus murinus]
MAVSCSLEWFYVKVRALTIGNWYVLSDEVFLGRGCPVTEVWQDFYIFLYPTTDCDIQYEILKGKIVFTSVVTFVSKTTPRRAFVFVRCTIEQDKPSPPPTTYIDPRQSKWLASAVYEEEIEEMLKYTEPLSKF